MPILHDACGCRAAARDFALSGAEAHYPPDLELEPTHLEIDLRLDLVEQTAQGTVTTTVDARRAGPRSLRLHAVDFELLAVRDRGGRSLTHRYDGRELVATWTESFAAGESRQLQIDYRVQRPVTGLFFSKPGPGAENAPWFAATDHETERARHWLPCVDLPNVRPRLDFKLRADARFTILANGALLAETAHDDGSKTAHYRLEQRCPSYLTCFAIGEFVRFEHGEHHGKPIAYFATKEFEPSHLERSFGRTPEMLEWLTKKLGCELPYPKYFQFALPGFGGAMENISLVSWDDVFVLDERLAEEWSWLVDQINIHEMAHTYFGDWVVCRDFAHAWLKESWATYIESCWLEDNVSRDEADYDFFANASAYITEADERYKRPIVTRTFDHSWSLYDRHLYPGGACRLHMLRRLLGDEVFWPAVTDYLQTFGGQVVETDDFRRMLEKHSGRSLVRFFDQWFLGKGYPILHVEFSHDAEKGEGSFRIEQKQVDEKAGVGIFQLELELAWTVEGRSESHVVELVNGVHTVVLKMPKAPEDIRIDPQLRVLMKLEFNPGEDMLRRQLNSDSVVLRIRAGQELAKTGRSKNLEALLSAYRAEPFWGVRIQWARALSKAASETSLRALAELVAEEQMPLALESVLRAAGVHRDSRIAAALKSRFDSGLPYRAAAAALEGLGAQRAAAPFDTLVSASASEGFGGHVQGGAIRALGASRRPEALALLLERCQLAATSNRARPAAAAALAELGRTLERGPREQVRECLIDLLRDPHERMRKSALTALETLGDPEAAAALVAYRANVSEQEQPQIDRILAGLRAATPATASEKQLEELQAKVRSLDAALERLEARLR